MVERDEGSIAKTILDLPTYRERVFPPGDCALCTFSCQSLLEQTYAYAGAESAAACCTPRMEQFRACCRSPPRGKR